MISYKFYSRSNKLYIRINLGSQNKKKNISLKMDIGKNTIINNKVTGQTLPSIEANNLINKIENAFKFCDNPQQAIEAVATILNGGEVTSSPDTITKAYEEMIEAMKSGEYRRSGKKITQGTIDIYEYALMHYKNFVGNRDIPINEIDLFGVDNRKTRKVIIQKTQTHFQGFIDYMSSKGLRASTQRNYWTKMLTFFSYLQKTQGVAIESGFASTQSVQFDTVVWNNEQISLFLTYNPSNPKEKAYYDVFRLQFFTCSRISEIFSLTEDDFNIKMTGEGPIYTVKKITKKDSKLLERPVPKEIWESCRNYIRQYGEVIVNGNTVQYNRILKKMLRNIKGFDTIETIFQEVNGKTIPKEVSMIDQSSSHMLRKAGSAFYEDQGLSEELITRHLTGHTKAVYDSHYRRNLLKKEDLKRVAELQKAIS